MTGVLAEIAGAVAAALPGSPDAYGVRIGVPEGPGWHVRITAAELAGWCGDGGAPAASGLGEQLATAVLGKVTAALLLQRRAWDVGPGDLAFHQHELGFLDAVALRRPAVLVLPDDPGAADPDAVVVADLPSLLDRVAAGAVATLGPLFAAIREATRFGLVPLWNGAGDAVRAAATTVPLHADLDSAAAHRLADALVDALVVRGAAIRARGHLQEVEAAGRRLGVAVRASCCFYYLAVPEAERAQAYCTTCPHLDDAERARRFTQYAEGAAAP